VRQISFNNKKTCSARRSKGTRPEILYRAEVNQIDSLGGDTI